MRESDLEGAGSLLATLMRKGEIGTGDPLWHLVNDEDVTRALGLLLQPMRARLAITPNHCFLVPTDLGSPFLKGSQRMGETFKDQGKQDPGRQNLAAVITLVVLRKLLDEHSEDGLSQQGRGGVVPVRVMVDDCEDALRQISRTDGLSDHMRSALDEWERCSQPPSGRANVNSHEGIVRYVLNMLAKKGLINMDDGAEGPMSSFSPTTRLRQQAKEVLNAERYQEITSMLTGEEE